MSGEAATRAVASAITSTSGYDDPSVQTLVQSFNEAAGAILLTTPARQPAAGGRHE